MPQVAAVLPNGGWGDHVLNASDGVWV